MNPDYSAGSDDHATRRPPVKRRSIVSALRAQIVGGELRPGEQLPTRAALMAHHQASSITVQSALDRLIRDGMVVARGRRGTFVTDHPPFLNRYGLVFGYQPTNPSFGRYAMALCAEARRMEQATARRFAMYYAVNRHADSEAYHLLVGDIRAQRLAGLIFSAPPIYQQLDLVGTPVLDDPAMPRVLAAAGHARVSFPAVELSDEMLYTRAMDALATGGRKRVACLCLSQVMDLHVRTMQATAAARGLDMPSHWVQAVDVAHVRWAGRLAQMMFDPGQSRRPDSLYIADDTLVEPVTAALAGMGVRAPKDVEIIAHANFPWTTPCHLPARRVGFDVPQILAQCIDAIDQQRCGRQPPKTTAQVRFEDELSELRRDEIAPASVIPASPASPAVSLALATVGATAQGHADGA